MKLPQHNHKQRGVSLVELLVTTVTVSLGLITLTNLQNNSLQDNNQSKAQTEALAVAEQQLEQLRYFITDDAYSDDIVNGSASHSGTNASYSISRTVTSNATPNYKTVAITVGWSDKEGNHSVTLDSIIALNDPLESGKLLSQLSGIELPAEEPAEEETPAEDEEAPVEEEEAPAEEEEAPAEEEETPLEEEAEPYTLTISGSIATYGSGIQFQGASGSGNYGVQCNSSSSSYACIVGPIAADDSWTGTISIATNKVVCNPPDHPTPYTNITGNQSQDYNLGKTASDCP
ncbi:type IV pilus modification PilV family protein [Marinobacterium arenosum]|uniref:type IV pilus modification PilV family protein n=1 Tax=Marinobacterium arenosum TaxID=2862496 RepID=UPI001C956670|nr:hypothetical protein [Marinobacterium arenosum]MBY4675839.1 hypothetical protein [Marinobacterium arenosum]